MGKMKYVFNLMQDNEYYNLKNAVNKATNANAKTLTFRGRTHTLDEANAMLSIILKHMNAEP